MKFLHLSLLATLALALTSAPSSAQPRVTNGDLRVSAGDTRLTRTALDTMAARAGTSWIGYSVPVLDGDRWMCDSRRTTRDPASTGPLALESGRLLYVLYRLDGGRVDRIRIASDDCALDGGGLAVQWLPDVSAADSVAVLSTFLSPDAANRVADGALTALAMHRDPPALDRLLGAARDGATAHVRGQALFWLAQRAGEKAAGAIQHAIVNDPETDVKKRAVFALSQLPKDEGVPRLIEVARTNGNPAVRKQAMFWLGQTRDPRALKFFEEVLFK